MTEDLFRHRLDNMIDKRHPLAKLAHLIPWDSIENRLATRYARKDREGKIVRRKNLFGIVEERQGAGISTNGRPRIALRRLVALTYCKYLYNLSDEAVVARWAQDLYMQYLSGEEHFQPCLPCDATQLGRFRTALGEEGCERLLQITIEAAHKAGAITKSDCQQVVVDSTVQEKAIAHPTDSRLLEKARISLVKRAKSVSIRFNQTFVREAKRLVHKASGYAYARQYKRLNKVIKRQRTILGVLLREVQRKSTHLQGEAKERLEM